MEADDLAKSDSRQSNLLDAPLPSESSDTGLREGCPEARNKSRRHCMNPVPLELGARR
jgi:hypothetical protein